MKNATSKLIDTLPVMGYQAMVETGLNWMKDKDVLKIIDALYWAGGDLETIDAHPPARLSPFLNRPNTAWLLGAIETGKVTAFSVLGAILNWMDDDQVAEAFRDVLEDFENPEDPVMPPLDPEDEEIVNHCIAELEAEAEAEAQRLADEELQAYSERADYECWSQSEPDDL